MSLELLRPKVSINGRPLTAFSITAYQPSSLLRTGERAYTKGLADPGELHIEAAWADPDDINAFQRLVDHPKKVPLKISLSEPSSTTTFEVDVFCERWDLKTGKRISVEYVVRQSGEVFYRTRKKRGVKAKKKARKR